LKRLLPKWWRCPPLRLIPQPAWKELLLELPLARAKLQPRPMKRRRARRIGRGL